MLRESGSNSLPSFCLAGRTERMETLEQLSPVGRGKEIGEIEGGNGQRRKGGERRKGVGRRGGGRSEGREDGLAA